MLTKLERCKINSFLEHNMYVLTNLQLTANRLVLKFYTKLTYLGLN